MPKGLQGFQKGNQFGKLHRGKPFSEKHKENISKGRKGILSEEGRKKLIKRNKERGGRNHWHWKNGLSRTKKYLAFYERRRQIRKRKAKGFHTIGEWELLKKQYGHCCPACEKCEPEIKLTEDHIIPLSKGGSDFIENIQPLCRSCNSKKATKIISYLTKHR